MLISEAKSMKGLLWKVAYGHFDKNKKITFFLKKVIFWASRSRYWERYR
jgi:hypothetical protein